MPFKRHLPDDLQVPVIILEGRSQRRLLACRIKRHGLFIRTDTPAVPNQLLRLRIPTHEDPPPLDILAVVLPNKGPEEVPGILLHFYGLLPYTRTRLHRWLTWLQEHSDDLPLSSQPNPPQRLASAEVRAFLQRLNETPDSIQRQHIRYAVSWQIRIYVEDKIEETHTSNLSNSGAMLLSNFKLSIKQQLELDLYHPDSGRSLRVQARIVHDAGPCDRSRSRWRYGAEFIPDAKVTVEHLETFISSGIPSEERDSVLLLIDPGDPKIERP